MYRGQPLTPQQQLMLVAAVYGALMWSLMAIQKICTYR